MNSKSFILIFLTSLFIQSSEAQQLIGFSYFPNPDVIQCGDFFFYIQSSSTALTLYAAATGSAAQQSYQVQTDFLQNKQGTLTPNCENETIDQLWKSKRAFRIFNFNLVPNLSIFDTFPDVLKCGNDIVFLHSGTVQYVYRNRSGKGVNKVSVTAPGGEFSGINCGAKTLEQLKNDDQAFNIVSKKVQAQGPSIFSMFPNFPDVLSCSNGSIIYLYKASALSTIYRSFTPNTLEQLELNSDGRFQSASGGSINQCKNKSLSQLIDEGRAFYLNTPLIQCPDNITTDNPIVEFQILTAPGFTSVSKPASNTFFPYSKTTTVNVQATNASNHKLSCSFDVTLGPDKVSPKLACPQDIKQKNPLVDFEASATDNDPQSPVKITYDKAPKTQFPIGQTTTVSVTATDNSGNQAMCTFKVSIDQQLKQIQVVSQIMTYTQHQEKDSQSQGSNLGIIIGAVVAGLAAIITLVVLFFCKKHKTACFNKKNKIDARNKV